MIRVRNRLPFLSVILLFFLALSVNSFILYRISRDSSPLSRLPEKQRTELLADEILSRMTAREKIGQLVMVNYYGNDLKKVRDLIRKYHLSGILLKGENVKNRSFEQVRDANIALSRASERFPLLISVDQEGGEVSRLNGLMKNLPSPSDIYRARGKEGIAEAADYTSARLKDLRINVNFSPVIDLAVRPDSVIYKRSFSSDPEINSGMGRLYIEHSRRNGVIAVPKHFPGYGNTGKDPHFEVCVDDTSSLDEISAPFLALTDSEMIMSSHVIFRNYDSRPATLSRKVMKRLRDSYSNVIITDDIQMKAVTKIMDYRKAALESLLAGCDVVLSVTLDENKWYQNAADLCDYLFEKYQDGDLPETAVNENVRRVIRMKLSAFRAENWGILKSPDKYVIVR